MQGKMRFGLAIALLLFSVLSWAGEVTVIENDALRITFGAPESGYAISAIENKLVGNARFVHLSVNPSNFWEIVLSARDDAGCVVKTVLNNHSPAAETKIERVGDETRFIWKGLDISGGEKGAVDVVARISLPPGEAASEWRLAVRNRSAKWALHTTVYPQLQEVVRAGEADVLMPYENLGARLLKKYDGKSRNRLCQWGEYPYPSYFPPVAAYMIGEAGLYVAAEDSEARIKRMFTWDLNAWFETPVENAGVVGKAAEGPRYAVKIAAFRGDWWQAAKLYRTWALKQMWCAKGPLCERKDFPKSMSEPSMWVCRYMSQAKTYNSDLNRIRKDLPDVTLGVRVYDWHNHGMDWNFPEFLPQREGVSEAFGQLRRDGWTVMPYINGRLWDVKLMSFDYAKPDACRDEDGTVFTEPWFGKPYGKHEFAIMCPAVARWRNLLQDLAVRTVEETHANAVYYDQVGCAAPRACHNPSHGHPLGGGTWWADGYRKMFRRARDVFAPKGIAITTEGTAECYMDLCDGQLIATAATGEDVPFYPAVYSGYAIYFGSRQSVRTDFDTAFALMAREFVWGVANCWGDDWYPNRWGTVKETAEAAHAFAKVREGARDFFVYGTLEDELRPLNVLEDKVVTRELFSGSNRVMNEIRQKAVVGAWWRNRKGERTLFAVNLTDAEQTVEFKIPSNGKRITLALKPREIASFNERN